MSELTLLVLRIGFLALLWVFIFGIVYALRSDLFGQRVRKLAAGSPGAAAGAAASGSSGAAAPAGAADAGAFVTAAQPRVSTPVAGTAAAAGAGAAHPAADTPPTRRTPGAGAPPTAPTEAQVVLPRGTQLPAGTIATVHNANRLSLTSGPKRGTEIPLGAEPLTIGRSSESSIVIRDDYSSTHHARLLIWNDEWMIQDLDSTNGTFLDGKRVSVPTKVPLNTPIKVGTTTFELRR